MNIEQKAMSVVDAMLAAATAIRKTERLPIAFVCKPYLEIPIIKLLENSPPNILVYSSPHQEHEICVFYDVKTLQEHMERLSRSDVPVLLPCGCEPHGHKCLISEGGCGRCVEHCACVSPTFGPRCLECGYPLTKDDPPETDKCKSCYDDYER